MRGNGPEELTVPAIAALHCEGVGNVFVIKKWNELFDAGEKANLAASVRFDPGISVVGFRVWIVRMWWEWVVGYVASRRGKVGKHKATF